MSSDVVQLPFRGEDFAGPMITVGEIEDELRRELRERARVYPRLVAKGQLRQATADRRCAIIRAAIACICYGRAP